jgi:hypothetical protein
MLCAIGFRKAICFHDVTKAGSRISIKFYSGKNWSLPGF